MVEHTRDVLNYDFVSNWVSAVDDLLINSTELKPNLEISLARLALGMIYTGSVCIEVRY